MARWRVIQSDVTQAVEDSLALVPFGPALLGAIGPLGLEPRVRQLAALAVAEAFDCPTALAFHRRVGRLAGLTEDELLGRREGLTAAERTAVSLALGTVNRVAPGDLDADPADEHYTSKEIRQLQALALAVALACRWSRTVRQLWQHEPPTTPAETSFRDPASGAARPETRV